ncbi:hypothetical protein DEIGR_400107 [Deinococcus grandis]|uniref:Uncharacterized protein n=1 Tax=Deinococcus grandis TaxID=57498 RepID=A0A100HQS8_9DEIO|nr:hypothetical protein [Deinococcus grandis]GAQ23974.1 hypothetical protein DEIGR_400107 [Deinococcus grandis]
MTLDTPQEIDKALRSRALDMLDTIDRPNGHILRARVALFFQRRAAMVESLHELEDHTDIQSRGLSILLCAQLGLHEDALSLPFADTEVDAAELNDQDGAYWAHLGRTAALVAQDQPLLALEELGMARVYAIRIGIQEHIEYVMGERQRIAGNAGFGCAEQSARVLRQMRPGTGIHRWHEQTYLTDRLAEGSYAVVAHRDFGGRPAHALARALLGNGASTDSGEHPLHRAAEMFRAVRDGRAPGVPMSGTGMVNTYTRIAAGLHLAGHARTSRQAVAVLGEQVPRRADQRVLWAVAHLQAFVYGAEVDSPLVLPSEISSALDRLKETAGVLDYLSASAPEALLLMAVAPNAHPAVVLTTAGLSLDGDPSVLGEIRGRVASAAAVQSGINRMVIAAADAQRRGLERQWAQAHATLQFMLPDAGNVSQSVHCGDVAGGATVKA